MASNLRAMASNLLAMASNLLAMASILKIHRSGTCVEKTRRESSEQSAHLEDRLPDFIVDVNEFQDPILKMVRPADPPPPDLSSTNAWNAPLLDVRPRIRPAPDQVRDETGDRHRPPESKRVRTVPRNWGNRAVRPRSVAGVGRGRRTKKLKPFGVLVLDLILLELVI